jgi:amino acid transporter
MNATRSKLGTFGGVFTPSILTILGLILFLRLGFVVGSGGVLQALGILVLATAIASLTSVSLAAIATNRRVRGGGDYYLISRSLGVAYGGALGLILFVAQAVSVGFYCVGFAEGVSGLLPEIAAVDKGLVAVAAAVALLSLAYLGADLATRFQYLIMAILGAALASFFVGAADRFDGATLAANWSPDADALGFWVLFAIFFPAVTGFTQGVSMSGDLRDPARSLPRGTFLAVGLAAARIFPRLSLFAVGHGPAGNPRRAVLLTGVIALVTINLGNLNAIAGLVSMFFLISYGLLNYATYVEATAASPSFRPRFRFYHARASLLGTLLCAGVMLALDPLSGVVAVALIAAIYQYVNRTAVPARWRDSLRAYRFRRVKEGLHAIAAEPAAPSDWQPQVLAFTHGVERRGRVLRFASWITGGSGIVTAASLIEGEGDSDQSRKRCQEVEADLRAEIEEHSLDIYPLAIAVPDLRAGMTTLVQSWGVGPIRSNTVLLNWMSVEGNDEISSAALWYGRMIASAVRLHQHVVVLDTDETAWIRLEEIERENRRIDVWWFDDESSRLSLLLAHLMKRTEDWEDAHLRILAMTSASEADRTQTNLSRRLEEYRIDAQVVALSDPDLEDVVSHSRDAALVFMSLRIEGMRLADAFGWGISAVLERLPIAALVAAAEDVRLTEERDEPQPLALPDEPGPEGSSETGESDDSGEPEAPEPDA